MTISKQKLTLTLALILLSAVSAQAVTGQENQETTNTETVLSERNARLLAQHEEALAAGLRPTLTLVDLDAECPHFDSVRESEDKDKKIAELQAKNAELEEKIQLFEAKNQPWNLGDKAAILAFKTWKNRKIIAALAAVAGTYVAVQYAPETVRLSIWREIYNRLPRPIRSCYIRYAIWKMDTRPTFPGTGVY